MGSSSKKMYRLNCLVEKNAVSFCGMEKNIIFGRTVSIIHQNLSLLIRSRLFKRWIVLSTG